MDLVVYVGRLDDPQFLANKDSPDGAVPSAHSAPFPGGGGAFWELSRRITNGSWPGYATQHIAYVAPASQAQINAFLDDLWGARPYGPLRAPILPLTPAAELRAWVRNLEDDGQWCLVAVEW